LLKDFKAHSVEMSEHRLRKHMDEFLLIARQQIMSES